MMPREDGHLNGYVWMVCAVIHHFHEFMEKKTRIQDLVKVPILVEIFHILENPKSESFHILENPKSDTFHILENANPPLSTCR